MNPKEFLKERLFEIFNQIKSVNIKYQYSEYDDTHLIEVTPLSEYNENELYLNLERDLLFDFNDKFFPSTILFLSERSLNKVTLPDFVYMREESKSPIIEEFKASLVNSKPNFNWNSSKFKQVMQGCGENNYSLAA